MTLNGEFSDAYVAVSDDKLYVLYGVERVVKVEDSRRIVAQYDTQSLALFAFDDFDILKTETLLSTCRLVATAKDGGRQLVLLFSLGHQSFVERLIRVVKNIKKGVAPLHEVRLEDSLFAQNAANASPKPNVAFAPDVPTK
jgi:hypothetical protein